MFDREGTAIVWEFDSPEGLVPHQASRVSHMETLQNFSLSWALKCRFRQTWGKVRLGMQKLFHRFDSIHILVRTEQKLQQFTTFVDKPTQF